MMGTIYDPISDLGSRIDAMSFSRDPVDLADWYFGKLYSPDVYGDVSTMPCSPGVKRYQLEYIFLPSSRLFEYSARIELRPGMKEILKLLPVEQMVHRSRVAAVASTPLQAEELRRRIDKAKNFASRADKHKLTPREQAAVYDLILDTTLDQLTMDWNYMVKYMKDHETSSTGGGLKWAQLAEETTLSEWKVIFDRIKQLLEDLRDKFRGWFVAKPFYLGERARSESFMADEIRKFQGEVEQVVRREISRARLVFFYPSHSIWSIFLPDKRKWYHTILKGVEQIFHINGDVRYPMVESGMIYVIVSQWLSAGMRQYSYDGITWDAQAGRILGEIFAPLLLLLDGTLQVPSGETTTSLLDTIAILKIYSAYFNGHNAVILGDDLTIYTDRELSIITSSVIEYQPEDTQRQFCLGLNYADDPVMPRIDGLKITGDRADKRINIPEAVDVLEQSDWIRGHHSTSEQLIFYGMYFGYFGNKSLIDAVKSSGGESTFEGPTQSIVDLASLKISIDDALDWTNEVGLSKRLLLAQ